MRKCRLWILSVIALLSFSSLGYPQGAGEIKGGENNLSLMSGGQTREYLLYIPAKYDGKTPVPLVLLLHGHGGTSNGVMELTGLSKLADENNFVIAAPQGMGNRWNAKAEAGGANDVQFIKELVGEIGSKMPLEKKRIYAMGFSLGARMASLLACDLANDIAAIGAVAGLNFPMTCAPARPVSIITFFGTDDRYDGGTEIMASTWAENNGCPKKPKTKKISKNINQMTYGGCKNKVDVVVYQINGGGHTWPDSPITDRLEKNGTWQAAKTNKDINATNLIWRFFEAHPLP